MKILYVAKHGSGGNDDEGSIAHALRQLGHDVRCMNEWEDPADPTHSGSRIAGWPELVLFHKWSNVAAISTANTPKVFWFFDRVVDGPWESKRRAWMERTIPLVEVGFCTDGDFVAEDRTGKLVWMPQGADERVVGRGTPSPELACDVLCVAGTRWHGPRRKEFVDRLAAFCKEQGFSFRHVEEGVYREALRDLVASSKVVVAPGWPVSDRYCSNRIWNMAGFGAFLLHPACGVGVESYGNSVEWYDTPYQLDRLLKWAVGLTDEARTNGSRWSLDTTKRCNLYRHRCEQLIRVVQERCR